MAQDGQIRSLGQGQQEQAKLDHEAVMKNNKLISIVQQLEMACRQRDQQIEELSRNLKTA